MASSNDYRKFLAEKILTEDKVITYRYLSRALGVHVNVAKQVLYEFHKSQNERKPGTIHATYLIYGIKSTARSSGQAQEDGDVEMTSSMPEVEEPSEFVPVYTLTLVKEEGLGACLEQYEDVSSIHVYSIGPHPMNDLQLLSDANRQVLELSAAENPAERSGKYGTIANPYVRRRERKGGAPKAAAAAAGRAAASKKPDSSLPGSAAAKEAATASAKMASKEERKFPASEPAKPESSSAVATADKKPVPSMKRGGSDIMQAFAKAATAKPKVKPAAPDSGAMSDDGEDDSEVLPAPKQTSTAGDGGSNKRKEREEALKRMMEEDDIEVEKEEDEEEQERADTPMDEPEEEPPAPAAPEPEEPAEVVTASTGDGRRRGRRRVMRKKQIMDEEGYLITIQEPGWESFSEDEAPPKSSAPKPGSTSSASSSQAAASKSKKTGSKGQGNIMSFFSKK